MGMFGLGDRVSIRNTKAAVDGLEKLLNVTRFRERLNEIETRGNMDAPYKDYVHVFLDSWNKKDTGEED
jgi:hypothetical protein